jgi:hypothetical protein
VRRRKIENRRLVFSEERDERDSFQIGVCNSAFVQQADAFEVRTVIEGIPWGNQHVGGGMSDEGITKDPGSPGVRLDGKGDSRLTDHGR